jgi:hypothetical protein
MNKKGAVKLNVGRSADRPASMQFFVVKLRKIYTFAKLQFSWRTGYGS